MISPVEERRDDQDETFCFQFVFSIISSTVPVPSGIFIPVFKIGAALGRAMGEAMALWFPNGVRYGGIITPIVPGDLSNQFLHPLPSPPLSLSSECNRFFRRLRYRRGSCILRRRDPHDIRERYRVRDDRSDHSHSANHDRRVDQQRHCRPSAAQHIRQYHFDQEAALSPRPVAVQFRYLLIIFPVSCRFR